MRSCSASKSRPSFARDDHFAIEHTLLRQLRAQRVEQVREVAIERLLVAALDQDLVAVAKDERAEAVPLGLEDPFAGGRDVADALGQHGQERRIDRKIHGQFSILWQRLRPGENRLQYVGTRSSFPPMVVSCLYPGYCRFTRGIQMQIEELNKRFGIPGVAQVLAGNGGLAKVKVNTAKASGEIYLYGAQVLSWHPAGTDEVIFVSEKSSWEAGRAIRGGIPICFPWFRAKSDDPKAPTHGFVRIRNWELESVREQADGSVEVAMQTHDDADTRRWWPHGFSVTHRVVFGSTLTMSLTVRNTGKDAFRFQEALHTYFRISDVEQIRVAGLDGQTYLDNMDGNRAKTQSGDLRLTAPVDNAYIGATGPVEIIDPGLKRRLHTGKANSASTIVWNPWRQGAIKLADLGEEEWHQMVCAEGGNILDEAILLQANEEHTLHVILSVQSI